MLPFLFDLLRGKQSEGTDLLGVTNSSVPPNAPPPNSLPELGDLYKLDVHAGGEDLLPPVLPDGVNPNTPQIHSFEEQIIPNYPLMSEEDRRNRVSQGCCESPFYRFVGNKSAVRQLARAAYMALGRENRACNDYSFAILGPASTGKTTLVRLFAETIELPFVEFSAASLNSLDDVLLHINDVTEQTDRGLVRYEAEQWQTYVGTEPTCHFMIPPMVVFIDEAHALSKKISYGLLKAIESSDRILTTEQGWRADCRHVCWFIATTDRGLLFDALDSRFIKVYLDYYNKDEMLHIIDLKNQHVPIDVLRDMIPIVGHIPREALDLVKEVVDEQVMSNSTWYRAIEVVAHDRGLDMFGLNPRRRRVLEILYDKPVSKANLASRMNCKIEELTNYIMPVLLSDVHYGGKSLVEVTNRGYKLTNTGKRVVNTLCVLGHIENYPESIKHIFDPETDKDNLYDVLDRETTRIVCDIFGPDSHLHCNIGLEPEEEDDD